MKFPIQFRKKNHIGQVVNNVQMVECHLYPNANPTLAQCIHNNNNNNNNNNNVTDN